MVYIDDNELRMLQVSREKIIKANQITSAHANNNIIWGLYYSERRWKFNENLLNLYNSSLYYEETLRMTHKTKYAFLVGSLQRR